MTGRRGPRYQGGYRRALRSSSPPLGPAATPWIRGGSGVPPHFGGSLGKLGVEIRREVVRELTDAGMSTRAIAPVVGVSQRQVSTDQRVGEKAFSPEPLTAEERVETLGESLDHLIETPPRHGPSLPSAAVMLGNAGPNTTATPRPKVVGIERPGSVR